MNWLDHGQAAMMRALDHGPAYLPADLFAGSPARVLAGMKVHANTISHARLVALEETFPRTRELIGHDRFNEHSRLYLEQPGATARTLTDIGMDFDLFLQDRGEEPGLAELARFELQWLASYHAADTAPLLLADLAGIAPDELMEVAVVRHPAASTVPSGNLVPKLIRAEVAGIQEADTILIARPFADVLISPATHVMAAMLDVAGSPLSIGNLLVQTGEHADDSGEAPEEAMQALVSLLDAGALSQVQSFKAGDQR